MANKVKQKILNVLEKSEDLVKVFLKRRYVSSSRIPWSVGYSEYKYDAIAKLIESADLNRFQNGPLLQGHGYRIDERIVEYPWFFSRLKNTEKVVLDAGSVLNFKQILSLEKLKGRELYIQTLYDEGRPPVKPSPSYIYGDLRSMCFRDGFFDAICSLSTIEHVGLDNTMLYTPDTSKKEKSKYGYLEAIREFKRTLKPGGSLYISIPYGIYADRGWFQVFDAEMIQRIVYEFEPADMEQTFFRYENNQWNFSDSDKCSDGTCFDIHTEPEFTEDFLAFSRCVVCMRMTKGKE